MKLVKRLVATIFLFLPIMTLSGQAGEQETGQISNIEVREARVRAHFAIGVKAPDEISLWYKEELLASISLYGTPLQKDLIWIIVNPFKSRAEFLEEQKYLTVRNSSGQEVLVQYFDILPLEF